VSGIDAIGKSSALGFVLSCEATSDKAANNNDIRRKNCFPDRRNKWVFIDMNFLIKDINYFYSSGKKLIL
jgi:hypothetical protein